MGVWGNQFRPVRSFIGCYEKKRKSDSLQRFWVPFGDKRYGLMDYVFFCERMNGIQSTP
jgi:hypothetical protein